MFLAGIHIHFFIKAVSWASKPDDTCTLAQAKFGLPLIDLPRSRES